MTGNPNYTDLQYMYKKIKANSVFIPSTLVGYRHVHIGLVTYTMTYKRITPNNPYLCPTQPSPLGVSKNGTAAQIVEGIRQNNITITTFHEENHIKSNIINPVQAALE